MKKRKGAMTEAEILAADRRLRLKDPRAKHGTSKHRKARVQAYVAKQKKKMRR